MTFLEYHFYISLMPCLINRQTLKMISQVESFKQRTLGEGRRIQQSIRCVSTNNNKDEDNSPKNNTQSIWITSLYFLNTLLNQQTLAKIISQVESFLCPNKTKETRGRPENTAAETIKMFFFVFCLFDSIASTLRLIWLKKHKNYYFSFWSPSLC